jgi:hypothetical protein
LKRTGLPMGVPRKAGYLQVVDQLGHLGHVVAVGLRHGTSQGEARGMGDHVVLGPRLG